MSGEMIAIIASAIALAAVLVPGQRGVRRDIRQLAARIIRVEERFDAVDTRLDAIDKRFGTVDGRLGGLKREIASVRTEVSQVETRLTRCIERLEAELKERIGRLEGYFDAAGAGKRMVPKRAAK